MPQKPLCVSEMTHGGEEKRDASPMLRDVARLPTHLHHQHGIVVGIEAIERGAAPVELIPEDDNQMAQRWRFLSSLGLCAARAPVFSLSTRYCGCSGSGFATCALMRVGEASLRTTAPWASPQEAFQSTPSPGLGLSATEREHQNPPSGSVQHLGLNSRTRDPRSMPLKDRPANRASHRRAPQPGYRRPVSVYG